MNFYLFRLRVSTGAGDKFFCYRRDGIVAAEDMEEALRIVGRNYSEDPSGDAAMTTEIVFLGGTDDNICYVSVPEYDRLKEFFDQGNNR